MKKFFAKATGLLAIALVVLAGCNQPADIRVSPETTLINTIRERFDARDYVLDYASVKNPYEQVGIDTRQIFSRIVSKLRAQNVKFNDRRDFPRNNSRFRLASNSIAEKIGIQNPDVLDVVASEISVSPEVTLKKEDVLTINKNMGTYSLDETGIANVLDNARGENRISQVQYDLLKLEWQELTKAKSYDEALIINATVEAGVISSNIAENQKALVLQVTSVIKNVILVGMNGNSMGRVGSDSNFKSVAAVVPYVVAALITAAAGYIVGFLAGGVLCGYAAPANCINSYALGGAIIGLVGWISPAAMWVLEWI